MRALMVLGSGSDVGKSLITAAIGRILADDGMRVAPFKAQNMANNAMPALAEDGTWGEIGTAQVVQARACRQAPLVEMNPILLKSGGVADGVPRVQIVVLGRVLATAPWRAYMDRHGELSQMVVDAFHRLGRRTGAEAVIAEGAGSCVELNLMARDVVNLPLARRLGIPWLLVTDIDRGGVFAQALGVKACLGAADWAACAGIVVNKLRGDPALFADGRDQLAAMAGKPVWVIPHLRDLGIEDEDGVAVERLLREPAPVDPERRQLVVPAAPHLAMASDLTAIARDPRWQVHLLQEPPTGGRRVDAVLLPGSKVTRSDLAWLRDRRWDRWLAACARAAIPVVGLCGGYQILGTAIADPEGLEGDPGESPGLGLLPVRTVLERDKLVRPRHGALDGVPVSGFELHCGRTTGDAEPLVAWDDGLPGPGTDGGRRGAVAGSYLHGLLDSAAARQALLGAGTEPPGGEPLARLARHVADWGLTAPVLRRMLGPVQKMA